MLLFDQHQVFYKLAAVNLHITHKESILVNSNIRSLSATPRQDATKELVSRRGESVGHFYLRPSQIQVV